MSMELMESRRPKRCLVASWETIVVVRELVRLEVRCSAANSLHRGSVVAELGSRKDTRR